MGLIDEACDNLHEEWSERPVGVILTHNVEEIKTISRAIAVEYFKKTYKHPRYASPKPVMAACVYLGGKGATSWSTQDTVAKAFGVSVTTVRKWTNDVYEELGDADLIKIIKDNGGYQDGA